MLANTVRGAKTIRAGAWLVAIVALGILSMQSAPHREKESETNPIARERDGFTVVGIAVRTSNAKEMTADGVIGKQWGRFIGERLLEKIPNKTDENILAVYTDYASDKDGEYTYLLGARVSKADSIPAGMVAKNVPAGKYALFTSEKGPVQNVVVGMWRRVWATPKSELGGDRAYKADYELYDQRARNPGDSVVELYVGIR